MVQRTRAGGISQMGRPTQGVKVMNMKDDDVVSAVALVVDSDATSEPLSDPDPQLPVEPRPTVDDPAGDGSAPDNPSFEDSGAADPAVDDPAVEDATLPEPGSSTTDPPTE